MKSFSTTLIFIFLLFSGCSIFFGTIGCKNPAFPGGNQKAASSLTNCCFDSGSQNPHGPLKIICAENPRKMNALAFIKQQFDNNKLELAYYPVLTPKLIHELDSLNTLRGHSAPDYYVFVFANDTGRYTIPISKAEIDSGKLTAPDSGVLMSAYDPPLSAQSSDTTLKCVYPHCGPKEILMIKANPIDSGK